MLDLLDDLAEEVSGFLRERLGEEIRLQERRAGTKSVEAWELVRRAERLAEDFEQLFESGGSLPTDCASCVCPLYHQSSPACSTCPRM